MRAKIRSAAGNLWQNPQEAVIGTNICFLTNNTEPEKNEITRQLLVGPNAL